MIALWSRATRTPGTCGCIPCVSHHVSLASKAGVFGARGGILLKNPTPTFVYTTIFAAALATDAQSKRRRNEQWDLALEQSPEEIEKPDPTEKDHDVAFSQSSDMELLEELMAKSLDWDHINRIAGMELLEDKVFDEIQFEIEANSEFMPGSFWSLLPYDNRLPNSRIPTPQWPVNTGPNLIRHHLPPQSLWAPENMRWKAVRRRQTWKKLAIQELSIGILIHHLLERMQANKLPARDLKSLSPQIKSIALLKPSDQRATRRSMKKCLRIIHEVNVHASDEEITNAKRQTEGQCIPSYSQDSDGDFYETTAQMNNAIRDLLKDVPKDRGDGVEDGDRLITAKICHNLFVSPAAPDLQTFNLLMVGFKRRGLHHLVEHVIKAFDVCKIRPNEITCAAILDHYVQTDNPEAFSYFFARMRGVKNALMLARPDIQINEMGQNRLIRLSEKKVYQKVYPTPVVFNVLMSGVLKFAGFDRAIDIYLEMKEDGWGLDAIALSQFLLDCVKRRDWDGGLIIWKEIISIPYGIPASHMANAYAYMLGLCSATGNTIAFNQLLNEVARRGYDRKKIMASAVRIVRKAQVKSGNIAPAWAADNLLIAVSDYMDNCKNVDSDEKDPGFQAAFGKDSEMRLRKTSSAKSGPAAVQSKPIQDPDKAWALWMSHELGEPMPTKDETGTPPVKS